MRTSAPTHKKKKNLPKPKKRGPFRRKNKDSRTIEQMTVAMGSANGELADIFPTWSRYLRNRPRVRPIGRLVADRKGYLLWGLQADEMAEVRARPFAQLLDSPGETPETLDELAADWLARFHGGTWLSPLVGLEALAWASQLAYAPDSLTPHVWAEMLDRLMDLASSPLGPDSSPQIWLAQLLSGELALTLAYCFPELPACARLASPGGNFLSESLVELLDGAGMLGADHLDLMRKLLASWTRGLRIVDELSSRKSALVSRQARTQFGWLVRQSLRLTRPNGSHALGSNQHGPSRNRCLFEAALKLVDDRQDRALARLLLDQAQVAEGRLPRDSAYHSEWGGVAVLQPDWSPSGARLVVAYGDNRLRIELTNRRQVVLSGPWVPNIAVDGDTVQVASDWECVCWFSDNDVDFMELETTLSNGWTLQRQFLMARQDMFLWTADVLLGHAVGNIEYSLDMPLPQQVTYQPAVETTEGQLVRNKPLALVCAPSLPEWRSACRTGALQASTDTHAVRISHRRRARAAYFPLFFDLHRRRMTQGVTWRQLTVAEHLEIVNHDVAVGFRVHVGLEQWIFYRSLTPTGNRTVMGQNHVSEFTCGRFLNDGDVEPLIEVEAARE